MRRMLRRAYWKKTSRPKRKIQKMPMECQYHAVQSTKIWRSSMRWSMVEGGERGGERKDAEHEVGAVRAGDEVEEVAAGVGGKEEALGGEVIPGHPLPDEEGDAEGDGGDEPGCGAAGGGTAHAEPLFHHIEFVEELAAGHSMVTLERMRMAVLR